MTVVAVLLPRFPLVVAAGGRASLLRTPAALAPEPGREQLVGEVSPAAEAFGVRPGMRVGEALARCPRLALVPPDPVGVADAWERVVVRLEAIGAGVESERAGLACFAADGLRRLHGGHLDGTLEAARRALGTRPVRLGAGPSRFVALAAAHRARIRRPVVLDARGLAGEPVGLLGLRPATAALPDALERLGVLTIGDVARLGRAHLADRFGDAGLAAHRLARGLDEAPLVARVAGEALEEALELPEAGSGAQLERALHLLVDRVLARRERRGRSIRALAISARLVEGGTWRDRVVFREALADPARMRLALGRRVLELPAPAETLRLSVERFGPPDGDQRSLVRDSAERRRGRLREAVAQARAAAGPDAALRVLAVDPDSRVPERRAVLTPFE
jgi:nucleotidyltransferase/DNA polymerase involved in DNA repair